MLAFQQSRRVLDALPMGRKVMVGDHFWVVGAKPGHAQTEADRSKVLEYTELCGSVGRGGDLGPFLSFIAQNRWELS